MVLNYADNYIISTPDTTIRNPYFQFIYRLNASIA